MADEERWPFLICRNGFDKPIINDDGKPELWSWDLPKGWMIAFGEMMWDEIKAELAKFDYVDKWRIVQAKEKFGEMRIYHDGVPDGCKVDEIIDKYSVLASNICVVCGKPDCKITTNGWITPLCRDCYGKLSRFEYLSDKEIDLFYENETKRSTEQMADWDRLTRYYPPPNCTKVEINRYIGDTAERIRENYEKRISGMV